jgi:hypothetical protein
MLNVTPYVTAALAVLLVVGVLVMLGLGIVIPPELWAGFGLVLGFFFGNQTGQAQGIMKSR